MNNSETGVGFPIDLKRFAFLLPVVAYPMMIAGALGCITAYVKHPGLAVPFGALTFVFGSVSLLLGAVFTFLLTMLDPE